MWIEEEAEKDTGQYLIPQKKAQPLTFHDEPCAKPVIVGKQKLLYDPSFIQLVPHVWNWAECTSLRNSYIFMI